MSGDSATFQFHQEDHTLGNALRYMLSKDPKVQFAGYCVPHPSEAVMNVRVQCEKDARAEIVVDHALSQLSSVFSEISSSFEKAVIEHKKKGKK
jgi:DNA-directed RNA polymerase I and III subunit RPAC2